MKSAIAFAAAVIVAMIMGRVAASETHMLQKYNVGGFIQVPGSTNYEFKANSDPVPLPTASDEALARSVNSRAIRAAAAYMKNFPKTTAFMLIDHGEVVFEAYQGLGSRDSEFFSMSIGKSLSSLAVGKALCDGMLAGLEQRAGEIVPELNRNNLGKSTIRQLLMMSSGVYRPKKAGQPRFVDGLGRRPRTGKPFQHAMFWPIRLGQVTVADVLWGPAWEKIEDKNVHPPGEAFHYKSSDTLALSIVVEQATGMSLAEYFDQKIWRSIRSDGGAHWEADRNGSTISASGFQARLTDWGRLALWILRERKKSGCYGDYLRAATSKQIVTGSSNGRHKNKFRGYGYQWWTDNVLAPGFWGIGFAGQYLGLNPSTGKILIKFSYGSTGQASRELFEIFNNWNVEN